MGEQAGAGCRDHRLVAASVIAMFVGVENLFNFPPILLRDRQALLMIQRVDREGLTRIRTDNQIIEVAVVISGPDLFNNHFLFPQIGSLLAVYYAREQLK